MMISNAISFFDLLDLIGTLATVTALIYTVRAFQKSVRIQEANFLQNLFDGFHRDRQTILDNPTALAILAKEREVAPEEIIRQSIGSFDINRAYRLYYLHQQKLIPDNRWERDMQDLSNLFRDQLVHTRWKEIQNIYPEDFKNFIETTILQSSTSNSD